MPHCPSVLPPRIGLVLPWVARGDNGYAISAMHMDVIESQPPTFGHAPGTALLESVDFLRLEASGKLKASTRSELGHFMTPAVVARLIACQTGEGTGGGEASGPRGGSRIAERRGGGTALHPDGQAAILDADGPGCGEPGALTVGSAVGPASKLLSRPSAPLLTLRM